VNDYFYVVSFLLNLNGTKLDGSCGTCYINTHKIDYNDNG